MGEACASVGLDATGDANAEPAAQLCGFRKSALERRLSAHRRTIFRELDTMKKEVAIGALLQADRSIGEIAASVGYADPAAFPVPAERDASERIEAGGVVEQKNLVLPP
jgi:AraC-like DNA-binding protein